MPILVRLWQALCQTLCLIATHTHIYTLREDKETHVNSLILKTARHILTAKQRVILLQSCLHVAHGTHGMQTTSSARLIEKRVFHTFLLCVFRLYLCELCERVRVFLCISVKNKSIYNFCDVENAEISCFTPQLFRNNKTKGKHQLILAVFSIFRVRCVKCVTMTISWRCRCKHFTLVYKLLVINQLCVIWSG